MASVIELPDWNKILREFAEAWEKANENLSANQSIETALLVPSCLQETEKEGFEHDVIITYKDYIWIESRKSPEMKLAFNNYEFLQIVKFALSNGFELPQNEDGNE